MKLPFPRHMLARSSQGAVLEDDGILTVPPVVLPHAIIGTPLDLTTPVAANATLNQSFLFANLAQALGVQASNTLNLPIFGQGMWHVFITISYGFSGTANLGAADTVQMTTPNGVTTLATLWMHNRVSSPINDVTTLEYWFCIAEKGSRLTMTLAATVALDLASLNVSINASKLW